MIKHVLIALLLFFFCQCANPEVKNRQELSEVAEQINEKCPKMIDSETRLDGIEVKEPNTLVYRYTLINISAASLDTSFFFKAMWPGLISNIKISPEMKKLRDNNTNIEYFYQDKANKPVYTFRIGPQNYK